MNEKLWKILRKKWNFVCALSELCSLPYFHVWIQVSSLFTKETIMHDLNVYRMQFLIPHCCHCHLLLFKCALNSPGIKITFAFFPFCNAEISQTACIKNQLQFLGAISKKKCRLVFIEAENLFRGSEERNQTSLDIFRHLLYIESILNQP